jgi:2-keto-4-pentenoate hydratase/2-oxohepta-3-ene-1,7-dioic acid hydratase in catechol pathway
VKRILKRPRKLSETANQVGHASKAFDPAQLFTASVHAPAAKEGCSRHAAMHDGANLPVKTQKQTPRRRHLKMKLVRYGAPGREKPGIIGDDGKIRDLSRIVKDIDGAMLAAGGLAKIKKANLKRMKPVSGKPRLGPCIGNVKNFIAIGLNYSDHAAEAGMPIPKEPIIFNKVTSCICGPNDDTLTPRESGKLDYEVELGIVIGKRARYLAKDKARDAIAGYFLSNDVSERVFQIERSGGQWDKGKGCETFGPIGPWFVTKDEIKDPQNLDMWLDVNGERRQRGNTRTMIFGCEHLVWYCSQFFVMEPGDIIITGTPPGVALGMKPAPVFLKPGDVVSLGIANLGEQRQKIVAAK